MIHETKGFEVGRTSEISMKTNMCPFASVSKKAEA